jgi:hypothetical protein
MAVTADNVLAGNTNNLGIAQLISSLAPIFLGSGKTTDTTSGVTTGATNQATTGSQQVGSTSSSVTGANPAILAALLQSFNQANQLATDPAATQVIIDNIIRQSQLAFAPTIGQANSAGIYNSSTLGLLGGQAAAEAARQSSVAALNFRQQEQQIASGIGGNLLQATKTQDTTNTGTQTTQGTTTGTSQQQQQGTGIKQTGPAASSSLLNTLLGGAASIFGPGLLKSATGIDLGDPLKLIKSIFGGGGTGLGPGLQTATDAEALLGETPGNIAATSFSPAVSAGPQVQTLAADPATEALAALSVPGTQANAVSLGNLAANAINPQADLADPFVNLNGAGGASVPTVNIPPEFSSNSLLTNPSQANLFGTTTEGIDIPGLSTPSDAEALLGLPSPDTTAGFLGIPNSAIGSGGPLDFGSPNVLNVPTDIGNIFSSGEGFGQLGLDLANPIAGILGGLAGKLIEPNAKPVGSAIGGTVGGFAGGLAGGTLLGSELGSFAGPVGTALGALVGTIAGGLFGPNKPNTYSFAGLKLNQDGTVALGNQITQQFGGGADLRNNLQSQVDSLNQFLTASKLKISNRTVQPPAQFQALNGPGDFIVGNAGPLTLGIDQTKGAPQTPNLVAGIGPAFSQLQFTSEDPNINRLVQGVSFSDPNQLASVITGSSGAVNTANAAVAEAAPAVTASAAQQNPAAPIGSGMQINPSAPIAFLPGGGIIGGGLDISSILAQAANEPTQTASGGTG